VISFHHAPQIWASFPSLTPVVVLATGLRPPGPVDATVAAWTRRAVERLGAGTESDLPQVQAWRRAFAQMGMKPTQYRSAAEALLRRLRKEGSLPRVQPLVDVCNAISAAYAVPVAAIDLAHVTGALTVDRADGTERFRTFRGDVESPAPGEIIFRDQAGNAHARRWTNRQSGLSAVTDATTDVLIVAEALHEGAGPDMADLRAALGRELAAGWGADLTSAVLRPTPGRDRPPGADAGTVFRVAAPGR
jgi:DNA/RNA-binding domain of Phe-tRNA-synthetase-like protein